MKAKTFWTMILYLAIYFIIQMVVAGIFGVYYAIKAIIQIGIEDMDAFEKYLLDQIASGIGYTLIIAAILSFFTYWLMDRKKGLTEAWSVRPIHWQHFAVLLVMGASTGLVLGVLLHLVRTLTGTNATFEKYESFTNNIVSGNFFLLLLSIGILIPIFEEILFRGIIFNRLKQAFSLRAAVIIQAVAFGVYHFNIVQSAYTIIVGFLFVYAAIKFNSVIAAIGLHMGMNTFAVFSSLSGISKAMEAYGWLFISVGALLFIWMMRWLFLYKAPTVWAEEMTEGSIEVSGEEPAGSLGGDPTGVSDEEPAGSFGVKPTEVSGEEPAGSFGVKPTEES